MLVFSKRRECSNITTAQLKNLLVVSERRGCSNITTVQLKNLLIVSEKEEDVVALRLLNETE